MDYSNKSTEDMRSDLDQFLPASFPRATLNAMPREELVGALTVIDNVGNAVIDSSLRSQFAEKLIGITNLPWFNVWCKTIRPAEVAKYTEDAFADIERNIGQMRELFKQMAVRLDDEGFAKTLHALKEDYDLNLVDMSQGVIKVPGNHYIQYELSNQTGHLFIFNSHTETAMPQ